MCVSAVCVFLVQEQELLEWVCVPLGRQTLSGVGVAICLMGVDDMVVNAKTRSIFLACSNVVIIYALSSLKSLNYQFSVWRLIFY